MNLHSYDRSLLYALRASLAAGGLLLAVALPVAAQALTVPSLETFESALQPREDLLADDRVTLPERILDDVEYRATLVDDTWLAQQHVDSGSFARQATKDRFNRVEASFERSSFGHEGRGGGWIQEREYDGESRSMPVAVPEVGRNTLMITGFLALVCMVRGQARGTIRRRRLTVAA
jgi:hypothetical protein